MNPARAPGIDPDARSTEARRLVPWIFGTGSLICLLGAFAYLLLPLPVAPLRQRVVALLCLVAGVGLAAAARLLRRATLRQATLLTGWTAVALICLVAAGLGEGVGALVLGFSGLVICTVSLTVGLRAGIRMTVASAVAVVALAGAEAAGWLPGAAPSEPLLLRAVTQLLVLGFSLAVSTLIARTTAGHLADAVDRERRLRSVLHLASEWYWEMDSGFHYSHVTEGSSSGFDVAAHTLIGRTPWEIRGYGLDKPMLEAHRADLEAHRSFSGLLLKQHDDRGRRRYARISGEPRYDERGQFVGYAGVGRDATREVTARRAVAASETRYRELFERTPSPLVLHRWGKVIDANAAALALFGYDVVAHFIGADMLRHYREGTPLEQARQRISELEAAAVGTAKPQAGFELTTIDGRVRKVQVSSVRVQTADGPATLSFYFDETERLLADAALRRSEALLSHVVKTSPDSIVLSEAETGRFAMVNAAFTRLSGYGADEAVGRTSAELNLWQRAGDRKRVVAVASLPSSREPLSITFIDKRGLPVETLLTTARFALDGRVYVVTTARDVTQVERLRREYEAMLRYAAVGIAFTREHRFVQANLAWERMFGWGASALIGQQIAAAWADATLYEEVEQQSRGLLLQGQPYETEQLMRRADGSSFLCHLRAQAIDPDDPSQSGTIWIAEDVTERRRVEQALAAARDAAEAANRAKSAFLANTSHEIRTPLNGLLGLTRLALRTDIDEPQRQQYLRQILDSASNLSGIISDILDLSKIEAGKLTFESVPFELRSLLDALHRAYQELAAAHGLQLSMQIDPALPQSVHGDALRVRQILSNYINNALKFTDSGEIRISARCLEGPRLRFEVTDTGCGMDEATLARMFRPFTQADESTTRRFGGTGLGLSICRELATLMGGDVGATSRVGEGSTFWAELPLPSAAHAPAAGDALPHGESLAGARVLMVEDNPVNMMIAVATLEQWGVQVTQATDGRAAVDAVLRADAEGRPFHAVLMDVQMPVMGGHEATRVMRRRHDKRTLPIIALTAAALVSERDEALAAGMNEFLTKPIDPEKLRHALAAAVAEASAAH